ncbi:MAG: hypothetical protein ACRDHX_03805 [Chloroflexota bacterium]
MPRPDKGIGSESDAGGPAEEPARRGAEEPDADHDFRRGQVRRAIQHLWQVPLGERGPAMALKLPRSHEVPPS